MALPPPPIQIMKMLKKDNEEKVTASRVGILVPISNHTKKIWSSLCNSFKMVALQLHASEFRYLLASVLVRLKLDVIVARTRVGVRDRPARMLYYSAVDCGWMVDYSSGGRRGFCGKCARFHYVEVKTHGCVDLPTSSA